MPRTRDVRNIQEERHPLRRAILELHDLLGRRERGAGDERLQALADLLVEAAARIEGDERRAVRRYAELERRLLAIENSRFLRAVQAPGRFLADWKGRFGHLLLHSPFHPLYLKLANPHSAVDRYRVWLESERPPAERKITSMPLVSVILPVSNPRRDWLEAAVASVAGQTYGCWQLCVCDDASNASWVAEYFGKLSEAEPRICFVRTDQRLGISGASNQAAQQASGEYIAFLDQDDVLAPHALACVASAIEDRQPDLVYSDEDYLDSQGRRAQPIFKPAFSPDLLRCGMYFGHLLTVRTAAARDLGWLRPAFDGSQDYDLALRLTAESARVRHIPRVLYHWRRHANSTAQRVAAKPYTQDAGLRALTEAIARRDRWATVTAGPFPNTYRVHWPAPADLKASIVICSRNAVLLRHCLEAIGRHTAHANREIVVVEHRIGDPAAMDKLLEGRDCVRVPFTGPFHFGAMNNLGASHSSGDVVVFLNDDAEPLDAGWLGALLSHANRKEVGVVGAKLVYRSGALQHAGIALGIMEAAGHLHRNTFGAQYWNWLPFTRNVAAVTGACLAMRKAVFQELGGFDEQFPVNYSDVDLCLRARQAGYEVIVEPAAVLRHDECQSRQAGVRLEERYLFEKRWGGLLDRGDPYYSPHLTRTREDADLEMDEPEPPDWR